MSELRKLSHDHTDLEHRLQAVKKALSAWAEGTGAGAEVEREFDGFAEAARAHFAHEEEHLFGYARRIVGTDAEIDRLVADHGFLRGLLEELGGQIAAQAGAEAVQATFGQLYARFEKHGLAEADFLARTWNDLFPDEMMGG